MTFPAPNCVDQSRRNFDRNASARKYSNEVFHHVDTFCARDMGHDTGERHVRKFCAVWNGIRRGVVVEDVEPQELIWMLRSVKRLQYLFIEKVVLGFIG
jgi:hypothetical protein